MHQVNVIYYHLLTLWFTSCFVYVGISGYRYVHGETDKIGTNTNLNSDLRVAAEGEYGKYIEYTRTSGEKKRSYIIGPYPNPSSTRIYIGSGYKSVGEDTIVSGLSDAVFWGLIAGGIGLVICCCCIYIYYKSGCECDCDRGGWQAGGWTGGGCGGGGG